MTSRQLIINAQVVSDGRTHTQDVLIYGDRIEQVDSSIAPEPSWDIIDAKGKHLLPGMIDDQVHFREPGLTHKGDIATESAAAVAGGITSYLEMPNVNPPTINNQFLEQKYQLAAGRSRANFGFYLGASNDNLAEIIALKPGQACGVKVFMGASTGNMLVDDPKVLEQIFANSPVPIATHCEDTPTILINEQRYRDKYGEAVPIECHPLIRSAEACYQSSSLAVDLARQHHTRLHVLHLTTARELNLFSDAPLEHKRITVEACVHHLFFDDGDYAKLGSFIKCNPAIKTSNDRHALVHAVAENVIDVIATDHAPHTLVEKYQTYFKAPSGMPLVQHALMSLLEHYHLGHFSLEQIVTKACHNPARVFGIVDRGYVREGYMADLVLVDLNKPYTVTEDTILYKCGWSPFIDRTFQSSVISTWVNGEMVYADGQLTGVTVGRRLEFENYQKR